MSTTPSPAAVAAIEAGMLDTCTIRAPGTEAFTVATGGLTPVPGPAGYSGACTVAPESAIGGGERARGGEAETDRPYRISIPRDATPVPLVGHIVTIDAVGEAGDPALVDKELVIDQVRYATRMARRQLLCHLTEASA